VNKVYMVWGSTGEYSDHCTWIVATFTSEQRANTFCERANAWLKEHKAHSEQPEASRTYYDHTLPGKNPYDPKMEMDYTGTDYFVGWSRFNPPLPTKAQGA